MNPSADHRLRVFVRSLMWGSCALSIAMLSPRSAGAETESMLTALPARTVDLVLLRPLGAARLAAGALLWVPVSVVQAFMDMNKASAAKLGLSEEPDGAIVRETLDIFVVDPARYVFQRPLGENLDGY